MADGSVPHGISQMVGRIGRMTDPSIRAARTSRRPRFRISSLLIIGALVIIAVGSITTLAIAGTNPASATANLYVNPVTGSDTAAGTAEAPFKTIQEAMNTVKPGSVVHLATGIYAENVVTKVDGTAAARITIEGPPSGNGTAMLFGTTHVMGIKNSYYTLQDFSIDGQQKVEAQEPVSAWPTTPATVAAFKQSITSIVVNDRLVYIDSGSTSAAVTSTVLNHMTLTGAGGECVRIRNKTTNTIVENTVIRYCGMFPVVQTGVFTYHNGEGVYIGTSPKSTTLSGYANDTSSGNSLVGDTITTFGSECLDIKENAHNNALEQSTCADNLEPAADTGSMVELRGYLNSIQDNTIENSAGYGVKIASDTPAEDLGGDRVVDNTFSNITAGSLLDTSSAKPGRICGNTLGNGAVPGSFSTITGFAKACPAS
jgi:hypothetical protein